MKFDANQDFSASAAKVLAVYADAETYEQLPEFGKISRPDLVDRRESADSITLKLRYRFTADLPSAATAVIDPAKLTWVEETTFDLHTLTARVRLLPDHYANKMQASATTRFLDTGDDASPSSRRQVNGELKVRVLFVAGQVERVIADGLREHLAKEAVLVTQLLEM